MLFRSMATRSEIIAILASGTSYNRFLRPYFIGGIFLAAVLWVGNSFWIPKANTIKANFQSKYIDSKDPSKSRNFSSCARCYYLRIDTNTFIGIRDYDTTTKFARGFFLEKVKGNKVVYNIRSESISWDTLTKKWKLFRVAERNIDSIGERMTNRDTMLLNLNLKPEELRKDDYLKDKLTSPELAYYIKREQLRGTEGLKTLQVEWYRRTAVSATVLLLTMIGAVIASRKTRGGSGMHLAVGIMIAAIGRSPDAAFSAEYPRTAWRSRRAPGRRRGRSATPASPAPRRPTSRSARSTARTRGRRRSRRGPSGW